MDTTQQFVLLALVLIPVAIMLFLTSKKLAEVTNAVNTLLEKPSLAPATPPGTPAEKENTDALRLQACERLTLMLERINVPNLLLRLAPSVGGTAKEYTAMLLLNIRQEFEYNVTQQIYVSDQLWSIMLAARDNVSQLIVRAAEGADSAEQVASRLRLMSSRQPDDAIGVGQAAIRREASLVIG
ncbi:MAG: hypothetical protein AAF597_08715 [Bacteroidota bacterium]